MSKENTTYVCILDCSTGKVGDVYIWDDELEMYYNSTLWETYKKFKVGHNETEISNIKYFKPQ